MERNKEEQGRCPGTSLPVCDMPGAYRTDVWHADRQQARGKRSTARIYKDAGLAGDALLALCSVPILPSSLLLPCGPETTGHQNAVTA